MFNKKDLMNLESIIMLYAIKKNAGKRPAAKDLNTSIDTLNKYLEHLEQELGTKLISVNERGCSLTVYGEKVAEVAEQIKTCLLKAYAVAPDNKEIKGDVRIAYDRSVRSNIYSTQIKELLDEYSELSLTIDTFDKIPNMSDLKYDISLSYEIPKGDDVVIVFAKEVPCGFFASSEYLAQHPYPKNITDLLENHRLILKNDCCKWLCEDKKILQKAKKKFLLSNSTFVVNSIITQSGGVGIMPLFFTKEDLNLVCLNNIKCEVNMVIYLVSHRAVKDIPKIRIMLEYYKKLLHQL